MDNIKDRLAALTPEDRKLLLQKIIEKQKTAKGDKSTLDLSKDKIAIVGMAFRFPGEVYDIESFWHVLAANQDTIIPVPVNRPNGEKLIWICYQLH